MLFVPVRLKTSFLSGLEALQTQQEAFGFRFAFWRRLFYSKHRLPECVHAFLESHQENTSTASLNIVPSQFSAVTVTSV
jgi:hypothetical protein